MVLSKFKETALSDGCCLITATKAITARDLEEYMSPMIIQKHYPKGNTFYLVRDYDATSHSRSDMTSYVKSLYYQAFSNLMKLKGKRGRGDEVWKEMEYELKSIPLACHQEEAETCSTKKLKLSQLSTKVLEDLAEELKYDKPYAIVFAFSKSDESEMPTTIQKMIQNVEERPFEYLNA